MNLEKKLNTSGLTPCGHRVIVLPVKKERTTESGILIPDPVADREDMAQIEALVVAVGPSAWADQSVAGQWAKPGDRVVIAKFSGLQHKGPDGKAYRVISDLDVVAVVEGV